MTCRRGIFATILLFSLFSLFSSQISAVEKPRAPRVIGACQLANSTIFLLTLDGYVYQVDKSRPLENIGFNLTDVEPLHLAVKWPKVYAFVTLYEGATLKDFACVHDGHPATTFLFLVLKVQDLGDVKAFYNLKHGQMTPTRMYLVDGPGSDNPIPGNISLISSSEPNSDIFYAFNRFYDQIMFGKYKLNNPNSLIRSTKGELQNPPTQVFCSYRAKDDLNDTSVYIHVNSYCPKNLEGRYENEPWPEVHDFRTGFIDMKMGVNDSKSVYLLYSDHVLAFAYDAFEDISRVHLVHNVTREQFFGFDPIDANSTTDTPPFGSSSIAPTTDDDNNKTEPSTEAKWSSISGECECFTERYILIISILAALLIVILLYACFCVRVQYRDRPETAKAAEQETVKDKKQKAVAQKAKQAMAEDNTKKKAAAAAAAKVTPTSNKKAPPTSKQPEKTTKSTAKGKEGGEGASKRNIPPKIKVDVGGAKGKPLSSVTSPQSFKKLKPRKKPKSERSDESPAQTKDAISALSMGSTSVNQRSASSSMPGPAKMNTKPLPKSTVASSGHKSGATSKKSGAKALKTHKTASSLSDRSDDPKKASSSGQDASRTASSSRQDASSSSSSSLDVSALIKKAMNKTEQGSQSGKRSRK